MNRLLLIIALVFSVTLGFAQDNKDIPFNGLLKDIAGNPAKGARIYIEKGYVAKSDKKGRFGLTNVQPNDTIIIHYQRKVYFIPVDGRKSISIRLGDQIDKTALFEAEEDQQLADFGYGYVKRRESLDASNGISGEALRRSGQTNVLAALQGLVPGLTVNSTQFGTVTSNIRGINSLTLSTEPLFIVDGVETASLDFVSVYDVDTVEVLKDGSMYGSRGANGVIIVRTIRGSK